MEDKDNITYYRNMALKFINSNKHDILKIYLQHINIASEEDKNAILGINLLGLIENNVIDIAFIPNRILSLEIANILEERKKENDKNIIYFLMITPLEEQILELDIRVLAAE